MSTRDTTPPLMPQDLPETRVDPPSPLSEQQMDMYRSFSTTEVSTSRTVCQTTSAKCPEGGGKEEIKTETGYNSPRIEPKPGSKRVRFNDHGLSPVKRARKASDLEDMIGNDQADELDDTAIITLQMLALNGLQTDLDATTEENVRLRAMNREQTMARIDLLRDVVMNRGKELKNHGEFLIGLAARELSKFV